MIEMSKLARHRADTAAPQDDFLIRHTHLVRNDVRYVNVESEYRKKDDAFMGNESYLGAKLRALVERSGRSYREIAKAAGYSGASSVQRYFSDDYDPPVLPLNIANKLAEGFNGSRVSPEEVMALSGVPLTLDAVTFNPESITKISRVTYPCMELRWGRSSTLRGKQWNKHC